MLGSDANSIMLCNTAGDPQFRGMPLMSGCVLGLSNLIGKPPINLIGEKKGECCESPYIHPVYPVCTQNLPKPPGLDALACGTALPNLKYHREIFVIVDFSPSWQLRGR